MVVICKIVITVRLTQKSPLFCIIFQRIHLFSAPIVGHEATQLGANVAELPSQQNQQQQAGPPKRQRTASQRAQQQKARIQKQKELEMLKKIEDREYLIKLMQLRRTVRALVFVCFLLWETRLISKLKMINTVFLEKWSIGR